MPALTKFGLGGALFAWLLVGCSSPADDWVAGSVKSVNHVKGTALNWFSVNKSGASRGGGKACCIGLPIKWRPGLIADIKWEIDPNPGASLPNVMSAEWDAAYAIHKSRYRQYSARVEIPEYDHDHCGLTVHFLTCQQVKVTTSCWATSRPEYPIKEPHYMEEPAVCPR
ncbi:DUF3304 domain-containing protein [Pseudomonas sp. NPDC007930]|uniref:DUF3304 domain-containing protein n=1 Tax=Pseudomonas sp. NPDC007930 TaxID=3364417 RepID=UPI0036E2E9C7